jgi:xylulokinase
MILTCDIGTSSLKMGVIDRTGVLRWSARVPTATADARVWLQSFERTVRSVPGEMRRSVRAIAISGHGPTLVPVDEHARPTADALMWHDAAPRTGLPITTSSFFLPSVFRFAHREPRTYAGTTCFLPTAEYIACALTGTRMAIIPHDGYLPLYWLDDDIAGLRLDRDKFPPLRTIGVPSGPLGRTGAGKTGIKTGVPVFACGADFLMAILGSGSFAPGSTCDRGGTTEAINHCDVAPLSTVTLRIVPGWKRGTYTISGFIKDAGRWHTLLKEELIGKHGTYEQFAALADQSVVGVSGVRFRPDRMTPGTPVRRLSRSSLFSGVTEAVVPGDFVRALFEYTGFSIRRIITMLQKADVEVNALCATGGFAKSLRLNHLKATITGLPIKIPDIEDAELLGDAIVALTALSEFYSPEEAADALVRYRTEIEPDPVTGALYADLFHEDQNRRSLEIQSTQAE